ncbi:MAG: bifunctional glutamate N-acetyltransferase/amino-acid acetyltransferase ArgJ [Rhodospirillaceae bacterium]|jgi:glutamate N-acetyltransferase / amino-acid N-acetyltransferase|nr:bifunctional glutamate N-acetyltransferase/amino-acid acetyltransferase ArgJ [Rhodospirillaceae bacterium]MBT5455471.1 bifunctional glutamate N-acetyltransferase/amino-acid acetyltransferase ArgJ [Rhodospirillaceae bacterium]
MVKKSPLAPARFPKLSPVNGVSLAAGACGLKYKGRSDVMLAELARGTTISGVFTQSLTAAAPIDWCRKALKSGHVRAIVVNSGNANAFTGKVGDAAVRDTVSATAKLIGCPQNQVFVSSTGVIGEPLPVKRLVSALPRLRKNLAGGDWRAAADAIMTTDTFPKAATRTAMIDGVPVTLNGIAKGSGMIAPDMATMLGYVFTDAKVTQDALQAALRAATDKSFNAITVDSDTSTSDTVLLCATGQAGHRKITKAADPRFGDFRNKLTELMIDLAQQIVRDGEGASKFISVTVTGAASAKAAKRIALSIANSPLVKTAIAGEDANWGRIVMAVGKAGEKADRDRLEIRIGGIVVAEDGLRRPGYDETPVAKHMKGQTIDIAADVGVGKGSATVWTCDLTHGYIDINADYRT